MVRKLLTGIIPLSCLAISAQGQDKPNVIIIYSDDLGYGDLQCYGAENVSTPNIDRLAGSGIRFTNAHAVASTSTPSRYSLLTGEYPFRKEGTDIAPGDAGMIIRPEQFTIADMFKSAGYTTAAFGKWHLGLGDKGGKQDWNAPLPCGLNDLGFDYSYIMAATGDRVPCVFIENDRVANYDETAPIFVSYKQPFEGEPLGSTHPELVTKLKPSHGHNQAIVNGISRIGYMKGGGKALWKDENIADSLVCKAGNFIEKNSDKPFFIYFATNDIHVPRYPHDRFRGKNKMGLRGDAIVQLDWTVGEIIKVLKQNNILENTLIIFSSDNGPVVDDGYQDKAVELLNGHKPSGDLRGFKYSAFEGGTRVPFIVSWKNGIKEGQVSDALVSHIDIFRSLSELVKGRIPMYSAHDSKDALSALTGKDKSGREHVVEYSSSRTLSLRTKRWKYIYPSDKPARIPWGGNVETGNLPEDQLFDLSKDGKETNNVATEYKSIADSLKSILVNIENDIVMENLLKVGDKVPALTGKDQNGKEVKLSDFAGKKLVIYFYPKDMTSGCTAQACNLRDNYSELKKAGYEILGVSVDDEKSHTKFISKYELPFTLIADTDKTWVNAFGVWGEKSMYGRKYMGTFRTTFIVDENGVIQRVITPKEVKTKEHASQILK